MFDKFGEFNSAEEINRAAAAQLGQGDTEAIIMIAHENGIDEGMAQYYIEGFMPYLCDDMTAAIGKLEIEMAEIKEAGLREWYETFKQYLASECFEDTELAKKIRKKGKRFVEAVDSVRDAIFAQMKTKPSSNHPVCVKVDMNEARDIITKYYNS